MIAQEAIKAIEDGVCRFCTIDEHCDDCEFQMTMDALERQIPKPIYMEYPSKGIFRCAICDNLVHENQNHCPYCGQRLDWSEAK